jgi:hypothetical protein
MNSVLADFDLAGFWDEDEYFAREYSDNPLTPQKVALVETTLG